ncbi:MULTISPECIES: hypothetical protein [unclassified Streptomyces]|uniref:GAF domain-containing protein n=1 Tax=unclassified Streptomyces TaxID=2593676 RepID=UPI0018F8958C|nr:MULTISPECIES: hypothetical protein [unclassified Streptomyces]
MSESLATPGETRPDGMPSALSDRRGLAAVEATGLLDTGPEAAFDDLAQLAASVTGCARAFITLVDERRSFWKSCIGVDAGEVAMAERQNPVGEGFCPFVDGGHGEPFVVADAVADARTSSHPAVTRMKIGAWAGPATTPLSSPCVSPRTPDERGRPGASVTPLRPMTAPYSTRRALCLPTSKRARMGSALKQVLSRACATGP